MQILRTSNLHIKTRQQAETPKEHLETKSKQNKNNTQNQQQK